jgi:glycosyltransferase A (GT-A) superfamily protein (DUF2064 family)
LHRHNRVIAPRAQTTQRIFICVLASPPGRASQLRTHLGTEGAACLARAFFDDTWASVSALPWAEATATLFDGPEGAASGSRLERLLARTLERGGPALAVFADGPGVPRLLLDRARVALGRADAVLGPREGGGLYLVGLSRPAAGVLAGVSLADPDAFALVRDRLRSTGYSIEVLAHYMGAASAADLARLRAAIERGEVRAPASARALDCAGPAAHCALARVPPYSPDMYIFRR